MNKTTKVAKDRLRGGEHERDSKPTTQKAIQTKNSNKIKEIMTTFSASKPTNVDAQRIVCVLDSLIEKVLILQYIDSDLFNSLNDKAKTQEKEELLSQLTNNSHLLLTREQDYETKLKPLLSGQDNADKTATADEGNSALEFGTVVAMTAKNLRNLVRELQTNSIDFEIVKRLRKNGPLEDYEDFLTYLRGLRLLMLKRLSTSVEEQASHDKQKEELDRKIQLWERTKTNKETELRNLKKEKEKYITEKDEELSKLRAQIEEIEMDKNKQMSDLESESKKDQEAMAKNFDDKKNYLEKQLQALETELKELRAKNKAEEHALREKKERDESYVKQLVDEYDQMMGDYEQRIGDLETELQDIDKETRDYEESLAILKKEEEKEKAIDKKIEKKKELHATEQDRINKIVQSIQDAWKLYKVKAKTVKKKKGGKGKDGKGKDGKDAKGGKKK